MSRDGISGLMKACETAADNEEICLMLLEKGADPNAKQEVQKEFVNHICSFLLYIQHTFNLS